MKAVRNVAVSALIAAAIVLVVGSFTGAAPFALKGIGFDSTAAIATPPAGVSYLYMKGTQGIFFKDANGTEQRVLKAGTVANGELAVYMAADSMDGVSGSDGDVAAWTSTGIASVPLYSQLGIWVQNNSTASQTNQTLVISGGNLTTNTSKIKFPSACKIVGLWASSSGSVTAGSVTMTVYDDGSPTVGTITLNTTNPQRHSVALSPIQVASGSELDVRVTTTSDYSDGGTFTADYIVGVLIAYGS